MQPDDHELYLEQWLAPRSEIESMKQLGNSFDTQFTTLMNNFTRIENYLKKFELGNSVVVNIHQIDNTLDIVHQVVLDKIKAFV